MRLISRFWLSAWVFAWLTTLCLPARARCMVRPGPDGEFATWLVAGPFRVGALRARPSWEAVFGALLTAPPRELGGADTALLPAIASPLPTWRPAASNHAWLDVGAAIGGRGARVAYAGVVLDVRTAGTRYLMLGSDDALSVRLDGLEILRRVRARASMEDHDTLRVPLSVGRHVLLLKLVTRGDMDLFARLTGPDFRPDRGVDIELQGVDDATCLSLAERAVALSLTRRAAPEGTRVDLEASFPGGSATVDGVVDRELRVTLMRDATSAVIPVRAVVPEPVSYHDLFANDAQGSVVVQVGAVTQTFPVRVATAVRAALVRAREVLPALDPAFMTERPLTPLPPTRATPSLPAGSIWSVERAAERLAELVAADDPDAVHLASEARLLGELLDAITAGRDPYAGRTGAIRRAYRSPLDGGLQEYSVLIPSAYRGDRAMPLVMGLHGLHGSAHRMLAILTGYYDKDDTRTHADRYLPPLPELGAILVAPMGFGDAFYRQQGEDDVMRVLDEVRRAYRIDPDRTYMTGLSMGGIGAASVPFHHPDAFAACAALCGYHSYFVRHDTHGVRRPWETFLMELRSNDRWADNGMHLPLYVVQGTLDRPVTNSTVLTERYAALGYELRSEFPALEHDVWSTTYAEGRIVPHFLRYRRDATPRAIRFRTSELRWNSSAWLTIDAIAGTTPGRVVRTGRWADVTLETQRNATGRVATANVAAFTLTPPRSAYATGARALTLTVDGTRVELPWDAPTTLVRDGARWVTGARPTVPAGGPVRELFDTPLIFVVGTGDPSEIRVNERVAQQWADRRGVRARYPIVRDDSYTEAMGAGRTLVLVGRSNSVLARMASRLPLRVEERAVVMGERRFDVPDVGAVFSAPNPDDSTRAVIVIAGTTGLATMLSRALPDLVPEYVVYDPSVAPARGRVLLGAEASVLAAGFYDGQRAGSTP